MIFRHSNPFLFLRNALFSIFMLFALLFAKNYAVGPAQTYKKLQDVSGLLQPGDTVFVDGSTSYPADANITKNGTNDKWIVIRGIVPAGGTRPVIEGSGSYGFNITADFIVLEGFKVSAQPKGIGVFGNNILVRGCVITGCNHGLIGYGTGTGNVTVEYCEFFGNGVSTGGATQHQIYMATDEYAHPGSVFRLQYCYLHDGVEGDNVKTRSERNEIYYNWIENAGSIGHGLGLFAPDPDDNSNVNINTAREDADVVGNVIIQARNSCARIGGDLPGYPTNGRYRFVNNTFILTGNRGDAIRTFNTIETLEMYNNVIYATSSGGDIRVLNDNDGAWVHPPRPVIGSHNWVVTGATAIPTSSEWSNTFAGSSSPFANVSANNVYPATGSDLINNGVSATPTITAYPFQNPLYPPAYVPPERKLIAVGTAETRPVNGAIDIGAYEFKTTAIKDKNIPSTSFNTVSVCPSPFTCSVSITFYQLNPGEVAVTIYSGNGQKVKMFDKIWREKGRHSIQWDGLGADKKPVKSGIYIITIKTNTYVKSLKIIKQE